MAMAGRFAVDVARCDHPKVVKVLQEQDAISLWRGMCTVLFYNILRLVKYKMLQ